MKPKPSSFLLLSYALPVAAMLAIIGALGFGLMMINKDQDMKVDQLNGKYKSMQFAREKIQSEATGKDLDSPAVGGVAQFSLFNPEKSRAGLVHPLFSQVCAILRKCRES